MKPSDVIGDRLKALAAVMILAFLVLPYPALGEGNQDPATQTDLCAHLSTHQVIYFDDAPLYTPLGPVSHLVEGPGLVETVCDDCGRLLSSEYMENAEEIREHTIRNGRCALCGYRQTKPDEPETYVGSEPGEQVLEAKKDDDASLWQLSVTGEEVEQLRSQQVQTALIRGGEMALVFSVDDLCQQMNEAGAQLEITVEMREDQSFFLSAGLLNAGEEQQTELKGYEKCSLRVYRPADPPLILVWISPEDELLELPATWVQPKENGEEGYWMIPWPGSGNFLLKSE